VRVEVFLPRPAFVEQDPPGIERVRAEGVLEAPRFCPGRAHPVEPASKKGVPLLGIDLEDARDDDHARLLMRLDRHRCTVARRQLPRWAETFEPGRISSADTLPRAPHRNAVDSEEI
jgi:hypothetical protein